MDKPTPRTQIVEGLIALKDKYWIHNDEPTNRAAIALLNNVIRELSELEQTVARLTADAERYRWLRENGASIFGESKDVALPVQADGSVKIVGATVIRMMETLDAAIDAALKSKEM